MRKTFFEILKGLIMKTTGYCLLMLMLSGSGLIKIQAQQFKDTLQTKTLSLKDCLNLAYKFNSSLSSANYNLEIAESQLGQTESANYPTLDADILGTIMDQDPIFVMEGFELNVPPLSVGQLQLNLPPIAVPELTQKLMDNKNISASINILYPLFTGGKISSLQEQGKVGVEVAKEQIKKTNLQVKFDVSRYYFAAVLSNNLLRIAREALERMEATLEITESVYKNGSLKVTKIDYLKNKMFVENLRGILAQVESRREVVYAALKKEVGLNWDSYIEIVDTQIPYSAKLINQQNIITEALVSNPDLKMVDLGLSYLNHKIDEMESGHYPTIFVFGKFNQIFNSYDYGMVSKQNKTGFAAGLGVKIPIFQGGLISNQVDEAENRHKKMLEDKKVYRNSITLKMQDLFFKITKAKDQVKATEDAMNTAIENRELNERAYYADMVGVEDLIQAQILESLMKANYYKTLFDHIEAILELEYYLGISTDIAN
jgi:outer membrane protein TolC